MANVEFECEQNGNALTIKEIVSATGASTCGLFHSLRCSRIQTEKTEKQIKIVEQVQVEKRRS